MQTFRVSTARNIVGEKKPLATALSLGGVCVPAEGLRTKFPVVIAQLAALDSRWCPACITLHLPDSEQIH